MPAPLKPADRRQRTRPRRSEQHLRLHDEIEIPEPPPDLLEVTRDSWDAFWRSALAEAVDVATDLPAIERLFTLRDERERAYQGYRGSRLVEGSQGQMVLNPLARQMSAMDTEIRQLEDRLGLTPKARAQLGITIGTARRTLEDMNRSLAADSEPDPRIIEQHEEAVDG